MNTKKVNKYKEREIKPSYSKKLELLYITLKKEDKDGSRNYRNL